MAQQNKDTNELIKVRRQKLADLQAAGKNPFEIMKYDVTHHSKEIKDNFEELEGKEVAVAGRTMRYALSFPYHRESIFLSSVISA